MKNSRKIIRRTRKLLATRHQWTRNVSERKRPDGVMAYCITGALYQARRDLHVGYNAHSEAHLALINILNADANANDRWRFVPEWNDDPKRTHEEVLALLDEAEKRLS